MSATRDDILRALAGQPLALDRRALEGLLVTGTVEELRAAAAARQRTFAPAASRDTAVIPIVGPLTRRPSLFSDLFGGSTYQGIGEQLTAALEDERVARVVLVIDSPGGYVTGNPELAAAIRAARTRKPIVAVVDGLAASAAYWLASQASLIVASPSSELGSIGVFSLHLSVAGALAEGGIVPTFIASTPEKVELSPLLKLSDAARAAEQASVDRTYFWFVGDVAEGRRTSRVDVRTNFGAGRMLLAEDAVRVGMADGLGTLEAVLAAEPFAFEQTRRTRAGLREPSTFEAERADRRAGLPLSTFYQERGRRRAARLATIARKR